MFRRGRLMSMSAQCGCRKMASFIGTCHRRKGVEAAMLESFVKVYEDRPYRFPTVVNHGGTVVAFAMDDHRRIRYATLSMTPDDPLDVDGWPTDPAPVPFPRELVPVGFAATDPTPMPQVALGTTAPAPANTVLGPEDLDPVQSSTARLGAAAPFAVVSDGQF